MTKHSKTPEIVEEKGLVVQGEAERLISQAIDKKTDVATMERLLAMRKELKAEWAKEQFDKAMARFQAECPIIDKNATAGNGSFGYKYATLDHIVSQVRDLLSKNGFSYTFDSKKTDDALITMCHVKHEAGHGETSQFEIAIDSSAKMNISQKDGAASSYGKRYAFCNAFGILTGDEDNDTSSVTEEGSRSNLRPVTSPVSETDDGSDMTEKQHGMIKGLMLKKGKSEVAMNTTAQSNYGVGDWRELTKKQASEFIGKLMTLPDIKPEEEEGLNIDEIPNDLGQGEGNYSEHYEDLKRE